MPKTKTITKTGTKTKKPTMTKLQKRLQGRELCRVLYTYFKPANHQYIVREAKKREITYSQFVDGIMTDLRVRGRTARNKHTESQAA